LKKLWIPAALALTACALMMPAVSQAQVSFPDGVASGDVTSNRAVLWTRSTVATNIKVEVFDNAALQPPKVFQGKLKTSAARDNTVKIDATGLKPDTQYWYQFRKDADASATGTFKTAPNPNSPADVKFTYSGDSDPFKVGGVNPFNNWETLNAARNENGDFFVYLGDTIYSDSSFRPGGPATTLADYRDAYHLQRTYQSLTDLQKTTSTYALMDDHEVLNDYDGQTVDPARYAAGRQAFMENMPIRETGLLHDPSCAGDPLYRTYKWGADTELFVLDERSCRSASVEVQCGGDLGPTLPTAVRTTFPFSLFLAPTPIAGCLTALNNPARTMLGPVQKAAFKNDLLSSTAQHKLVISELAIQQFHALPYDRWEGYAAERSELLNFVRNNAIDNVAFLTTDNHGTLQQNEVSVDRLTDPAGILKETITGPIATNTFQQEVLGVAGLVGLFAFNQVLNLEGLECRHLDKYSYASVDVNSAGGTAVVASKDAAGAVIQDQNVPGRFCTQTYGP
jgi:phosphodiesterase/alkaline phosphatase D-like protein